MLKISGLRLPLGFTQEDLRRAAAKKLRVPPQALQDLRLAKKSVDARKKGDVHFVCAALASVSGESRLLARLRDSSVQPEKPYRYQPPQAPPPELPPVVVGFGPAGMFAGLILAQCGQRPIVIERGLPVEQRQAAVQAFWAGGRLDPECNVQFGEGGAGAFSDGKLSTGTKDLRHRFILERLAACGAPGDILIDAKPHVGTDYLYKVLQNLRRELTALGADIRFQTRLEDLRMENGALTAIELSGPAGREVLPCRNLILCPGHSARDTFEMLHRRGVPLEAKPFAVGLRIEHRQADCDAAQYRQYAGHPGLPASTYKLSCHLPSGRGVFSFCVCPGGEVVAAASETGRVVTNGMSEFARDKENINGAILVNVTPEDFGGDGSPLAGVAFQRRLEAAAYTLGGGGYRAPAQRVEDFLARRPSGGPGRVKPSYRPGVAWTDLHQCLPPFVSAALEEALPILGRKLRGYDAPDAVLTAVESRSSSPVRISRGPDGQSALRGLYPCGEGAGYAGGILSAAADGMKAAEALLKHSRQGDDPS